MQGTAHVHHVVSVPCVLFLRHVCGFVRFYARQLLIYSDPRTVESDVHGRDRRDWLVGARVEELEVESSTCRNKLVQKPGPYHNGCVEPVGQTYITWYGRVLHDEPHDTAWTMLDTIYVEACGTRSCEQALKPRKVV